MAPSATPVAVSAPGKVLLAGGYLVLDREYTGLVFGLSARINVVARNIPTSSGVQLNEIVVDSPQFLNASWRYGYHLAPERGGIKVTQFQVGPNISANPFVETTLNYALTFISSLAPTSRSFAAAKFTILADNDYYSQAHSRTETESNPTRFAKFPTTLGDAHKTGLGSSAALVTSLTAAILTYYLSASDFDLATNEGQRVLHNLAQAAHCAAQGKVGSGFDVAAAVYGSHKYRRFSPSILKDLPEAGGANFAPMLFECVTKTKWDTEIVKDGVSLPTGIALRMCDVDCGSQTVGMVKKVLAWREQDAQNAKTLWDNLQANNEKLGATLKAGELEKIDESVASVRELIRAMGSESGVPIEPESQTALLDALQSVEGVYNGVVPGAGGFDALALVMKDDEETEARVKKFLTQWSEEKGGVVKMLDVKGEMEGARREDLDQYNGWLQ